MKNIFENIYAIYRNYLFSIIYQIINDEQYSEDILQETFIKIFKNIDKIENIEDNRTKRMVTVIAKNTAIDFYRKRKRQFANEVEYEIKIISEIPDVQNDLNYEESELLSAISKLPEKYRSVILLKYSAGFSNEEISEIMEISVSNVRKILSRGKHKLNGYYDVKRMVGNEG